jgi:hypothetical protein
MDNLDAPLQCAPYFCCVLEYDDNSPKTKAFYPGIFSIESTVFPLQTSSVERGLWNRGQEL